MSADFLAGAFTGGLLLLAVLSVLVANAYGERSLLLHAGAMAMGVAALHARSMIAHPSAQAAAVLCVLALSTLHLREVAQHVGSLRRFNPWPPRVAALLALLGALAFFVPVAPCVALGLAAWLALVVFYGLRGWAQSAPWASWMLAGLLALGGVAALAAEPAFWNMHPVALSGLLAFWAMGVYLSSVWRSRVFGENRWRQAAEHLVDPLTGIATPKVLANRVAVARGLMKRFGHPGTLLLVHSEQLEWIAAERGAQLGEAAALEAGVRIRGALGQNEVASRIALHLFALFSEGAPAEEVAAGLATRVIAAGLREELQSVPGLVLRFRVVVAPLPAEGDSLPQLLHLLRSWMSADVSARRHRMIHVLRDDEFAEPPSLSPSAPQFS